MTSTVNPVSIALINMVMDTSPSSLVQIRVDKIVRDFDEFISNVINESPIELINVRVNKLYDNPEYALELMYI